MHGRYNCKVASTRTRSSEHAVRSGAKTFVIVGITSVPSPRRGLAPLNKATSPPPNGSMNHYKSVVFITFQNVKTPELTKSPPVKIFWRRLCITSQRDLHPGTNNKKDCITCSQHCAYKQESFSFICYHTFFSLGRVAGTETLEDLQIPHTFRLIRKKWTG